MKTATNRSALRLAFACFMADMGQAAFMKLDLRQKLAFADSNGMSTDELADALEALAEHNQQKADALRRYAAGHGHA